MLTRTTLLLSMATPLALVACSDGASSSEERDVGEYERIDNLTDADIEFALVDDDLAPGPHVRTDHVIVSCDTTPRSDIEVRNDDATLTIDGPEAADCRIVMSGDRITSIIVRGDGDVLATGPMPRLSYVQTRGQGEVSIHGVSTNNLALDAGGGGQIDIGLLDVGDLDITGSGDATMYLTGMSGTTHLDLHGNPSLHAAGLVSRDLLADLSGDAMGETSAVGTAHVSVTGNAKLILHGDAEIIVDNQSHDDSIELIRD